jgi:tetratricopeptide (TPR) repeat protein
MHVRASVSFIVVGLAVVLSLAALGQEEPATPQEPAVDPQVEAVQNVLQSRNPEQQLDLAEQFIQDYPESPYLSRIYLAAASAHRMLNHFDQAVEFGERAVELNPGDLISLLVVSDSLSEGARKEDAGYEERLSRAEEYSQRALTVLPEFVLAIPRRPDVPEEQYKLQEQYLEAQARATLGYVHLRRDRFADAERELKLATELNQLQPSAADFERLGVVQLEQQELEGARQSFLRCSQIGGPAFSTCERRLQFVEDKLGQQDSP